MKETDLSIFLNTVGEAMQGFLGKSDYPVMLEFKGWLGDEGETVYIQGLSLRKAPKSHYYAHDIRRKK